MAANHRGNPPFGGRHNVGAEGALPEAPGAVALYPLGMGLTLATPEWVRPQGARATSPAAGSSYWMAPLRAQCTSAEELTKGLCHFPRIPFVNQQNDSSRTAGLLLGGRPSSLSELDILADERADLELLL